MFRHIRNWLSLIFNLCFLNGRNRNEVIDIKKARKVDYSGSSDKDVLSVFLYVADFLDEEDKAHFLMFLKGTSLANVAKQLNISTTVAERKRMWALKHFLCYWRDLHPNGIVL